MKKRVGNAFIGFTITDIEFTEKLEKAISIQVKTPLTLTAWRNSSQSVGGFLREVISKIDILPGEEIKYKGENHIYLGGRDYSNPLWIFEKDGKEGYFSQEYPTDIFIVR
jgi:hypothetical protein